MKYGVNSLYKTYNDLKVFEDLTLEFYEDEIACIIGPSGCGKTTLLNILTGAVGYDSGEVIGFKDQSISHVFQEDRLIAWKTVQENLEFVLKGKMKPQEREAVIDKYLKMLDLEECKHFYPNKLSGGMRQRIAVIRAYIYPSKILIMDEPFKSLDMESKQNVMQALLDLKRKEKRMIIVVTHDIEEAKLLGDKIITLSPKPAKVLSISENYH